jgi:hypothetical protein
MLELRKKYIHILLSGNVYVVTQAYARASSFSFIKKEKKNINFKTVLQT